MHPIRQTIAVARKDFRSELRLRYGLNSLGMFVVVTIAVVAFGVSDEKLSAGVAAGLIWVCMFFAAVTGLGRSFLSEEERSTILLLRLTVPASPVYFGKLLLNIVLSLLTNLAVGILFAVLINGAEIKSFGAFFVIVVLSSLGFAASQTIIAAIIARSSSKGALYPVLSFPVLLPLIILGVDLLRRAISGAGLGTMGSDLFIMGIYTAALVLLSYVLFEFLWKE